MLAPERFEGVTFLKKYAAELVSVLHKQRAYDALLVVLEVVPETLSLEMLADENLTSRILKVLPQAVRGLGLLRAATALAHAADAKMVDGVFKNDKRLQTVKEFFNDVDQIKADTEGEAEERWEAMQKFPPLNNEAVVELSKKSLSIRKAIVSMAEAKSDLHLLELLGEHEKLIHDYETQAAELFAEYSSHTKFKSKGSASFFLGGKNQHTLIHFVTLCANKDINCLKAILHMGGSDPPSRREELADETLVLRLLELAPMANIIKEKPELMAILLRGMHRANIHEALAAAQQTSVWKALDGKTGLRVRQALHLPVGEEALGALLAGESLPDDLFQAAVSESTEEQIAATPQLLLSKAGTERLLKAGSPLVGTATEVYLRVQVDGPLLPPPPENLSDVLLSETGAVNILMYMLAHRDDLTSTPPPLFLKVLGSCMKNRLMAQNWNLARTKSVDTWVQIANTYFASMPLSGAKIPSADIGRAQYMLNLLTLLAQTSDGALRLTDVPRPLAVALVNH